MLAVAERIAMVPPDIVQLNKRTVHRAMDVMGLRAAIRSGTELCALAIHQEGFKEFLANMRNRGLTSALSTRDEPFGDYRTTEPHPGEAVIPPDVLGHGSDPDHCLVLRGRNPVPRAGWNPGPRVDAHAGSVPGGWPGC